MRKWVLAAKQKNPNHLLISETWPNDYEDPELLDVYELIAKEDEKLAGNTNYTSAIADKGAEINQELKLKRLEIIEYLFNIGAKEFAELELKEAGLKYKDKEAVSRAIKRLITTKRVKEAKGETVKEALTFEEMRVNLQFAFAASKYKITVNIDSNISVAGYRAYEKKLKELK